MRWQGIAGPSKPVDTFGKRIEGIIVSRSWLANLESGPQRALRFTWRVGRAFGEQSVILRALLHYFASAIELDGARVSEGT